MTKTIQLSDVYGDDARYVGENSAAAIEGLPAECWPALLQAMEEMGWGDEPGIDCKVAKTSETLADFDASRRDHWSEKGQREEVELAGYKAIKYERFQLHKGATRHDQIVIDCGDCRAALVL